MLKLRDYSPALRYGAKILPQDMAGMIGLPYVGNIYYIDPTNGSDTYAGDDPKAAKKTLAGGYALLADNSHDVLVLIPGGTGTGTGTVETTAITWAKNLTHLVGNIVSGPIAGRARVTTVTASLSPWITVSGSGNSFHNIQFAHGAATGLLCAKVSGSRNVFDNCHIGVQNATALDSASAADVEVTGSENYFIGSALGFDSLNRTGANSVVWFDGTNAARNIFRGCILSMFADAAAPFFVKVGASGLDRYVIFEDCIFHNASAIGGTTLTDAMSVNANPGGIVIIKDCFKVGTTGWGSAVTHIYALGTSSNATYADGIGFGVNPGA
jgi:hypothetical protein